MSRTATMNSNALGGLEHANVGRKLSLGLAGKIDEIKQLIIDHGASVTKLPKAQRENRGEVQGEIRSASDGQKSDTSDHSLTGGDGAHYFPVRVSVTRREAGKPIQPGPSEIFLIPSDSKGSDGKPFERGTRDNLIHKIRGQFNDLALRDQISCRNIPEDCFWGDAYEVESIRINWDPKNPVSYENTWGTGVGRNETEVTDFNAKACLMSLEKSPINEYSLNVLIGPKGWVKKNWAKDRHSEDATTWEESGVTVVGTPEI